MRTVPEVPQVFPTPQHNEVRTTEPEPFTAPTGAADSPAIAQAIMQEARFRAHAVRSAAAQGRASLAAALGCARHRLGVSAVTPYATVRRRIACPPAL